VAGALPAGSAGLDILRFPFSEKLPDNSNAQLRLKWSPAEAGFSWLGSVGIMNVNPSLQAIKFEVGLCRCCCCCCCFSISRRAQKIVPGDYLSPSDAR
jgi:hypothetical protein